MHLVFGAEFVSLYNGLPWHEEQTAEGSAKLATQFFREVSSHFRHLRCLINPFSKGVKTFQAFHDMFLCKYFVFTENLLNSNTRFMLVCKHCKSRVE